MRSSEVGVIIEMRSRPCLRHAGPNSSFSSNGTSGNISPSMPISSQMDTNLSVPYENTTFAYVMNTMGTSTSLRISRTISKTLSVVTPFFKARALAAWITGPSAVGSEKGMPSSIRSAPFLTISFTAFLVVSRSGSPQVMNAMKTFPVVNAHPILLILPRPPLYILRSRHNPYPRVRRG